MNSVPLSPGLLVAHTAATIETHGLHHETISPDLFICGVTKLEDLQSSDLLQQIGLQKHMIPAYRAEVEQVLNALGAAGLSDVRQVRRTLRGKIGDGGYARDEPEHISRSDEVRAAFERASDIAADHEAQIIMVQHLLAALLEYEHTQTRELLNEMGVDVAQLIADIAALPVIVLSRSDTPLLDELGTDLTEKARSGELSPVIGRKSEMMQAIRTLGRTKKNCPVLVGEPGVGKSAIVEGLAQRIAAGGDRIHPDFHNKRLIQLNASALVSGTKYRGDFEERMEMILAEMIACKEQVIVFIDEIHQLIGAGAGSSGGMDAANIFKPALASGQIRLIGATTYAEYRQYIEQDAALERRFQQVRVEEPSRQETVDMLAGLREALQQKHGVTILDEAISASVNLSVEYITDRRLPDKAYTLLDDACVLAKYGVNISFNPIDDTPGGGFMTVTQETVCETLSGQTGIPAGQLCGGGSNRIHQMREFVLARIVGQDEAVNTVCSVVERYYTGMRTNDERPMGVLLFTGSTGVGKTELAKVTAEFLFHDRKRLIRLDMSEYRQEHQVARLIGAPPGYKGFEQGGQLTNALKQSPHTVVLIDEIEKAHADVLDVFLGLFDNGRLTDGQGRTVDGRNALYILTSNLGYPTADANPTRDAVKQAVYGHLRPEFINRLDEIVYFNPLGREQMVALVQVQVVQLQLMLDQHFITVQVTEEAVQWLADYGYDPQMGARGLYRAFNEKVVNVISGMFMRGEIQPGETVLVTVETNDIIIQVQAGGDLGTQYGTEI